MNTVVVASGREFRSEDLSWITEQVQQRGCLTRSELSREVCDRLSWYRHDGTANEVTCRAALVDLERRGLIELPAARCAPPSAKPVEAMVAPCGPVECSLSELGRIGLEVVRSEDAEKSRKWREMMAHHELGDGKLMGRQLRYLVTSSRYGWVGALAFSMPAFALAGRDQWIGWSTVAREANLERVVNNSRFLIAPWVRVPGLASKVLSACLRRLGKDWESYYGVEPLVVETFVDHGRYRGTCYRAANFTHVGETTGRGRLDCYEGEERRAKGIFVRALRRDFRTVLRREPLPKSPPPPRLGDQARDWVEEEIGGAALGDARRSRRAEEILRAFYDKPQASIPLACGSEGKAKSAYRFMSNPNVKMSEILAPHIEATTRRASAEPVVLLAQDTTSFNYTTRYANEGIGPIGSQIDGAQGLLLHDTVAFTPSGLPLGVVDAQVWARDAKEFGKKKGRKVPIEAKESVKWLNSFTAAKLMQAQCRDTLVVSVGDREADIYELFAMAESEANHPKLLVRSQHNRTVLVCDAGNADVRPAERELWDHVPSQPVAATLEVAVPRNKQRKQPRVASLSIHYAKLTLKPPAGKRQLAPQQLWAVLAHEMDPPDGEDAIQWMLLTTVEVDDADRAVEMVRWYSARWGIEVYHKTLKSGCRIEERQLATVARLENCLAFDMIIAWRVMYLTMLGRQTPDLPCSVFFEEHEWKALYAFIHKSADAVPELTPLLGQAVTMVARLGGYMARKNDLPPGVKSLWLGIGRLSDISAAWLAFGPSSKPVCRDGPSGE
jgi:hypothetical protein